MELPQNRGDIELHFSDEKFVIDTCSQINKDLTGLTEFPPKFDIDLENDVMYQVILQLAESLKRMSQTNLQQFIYRVELKERDFYKALAQEDDCQELAFCVLRREAQKV